MERVSVVIAAFLLGSGIGGVVAIALWRRRSPAGSAAAMPDVVREPDLRDVAAVLDASDTVVRLGETAALLWPDRAESDLLGRRFTELFDGDNLASPIVALAEARSLGIGRATVMDGAGENVRELIALDRTEDPSVDGILVRAYRGSTHQILNDAPIRASLRRLLTLLRIAFVAIEGDRIAVVNQELCSLFGLAADPLSFSGTPSVLLFHSIARLTPDPARTAATMNVASTTSMAPTRVDLDLLDGRRFVATCVRASATSPWRLWFVWERSEAQTGPTLPDVVAPEAAVATAPSGASSARHRESTVRDWAVAEPDAARAAATAATANPEETPRRAFERALAVTVDAEESVRSGLRGLARHVDVTSDAATAFSLMEEAPYDLVVLDGTMSPFDGADLTRELRHRTNGARAAVVILTTNIAPVSSARFLAAGADAVLATPFAPADLLNAVRRVRRRDAAEDGGAGSPTSSDTGADANTGADTGADTASEVILLESADEELPSMTRARAIFASLLRSRIDAIFGAYDDGDVARFLASVHGLGSPAVMVGADRLGRYCLALETTARAAGLSAVGRTALEQIESLGQSELRALEPVVNR